MSSVSQRVTDVCYHFSHIFEFSNAQRSVLTDGIKREETALSARQPVSWHDYACLTPDVYLESFTAIIIPIRKGGTAYCDNDVEGLSWGPAVHVHVSLRRTRCCMLNKPRLVLRLTNRARTAINWFKY